MNRMATCSGILMTAIAILCSSCQPTGHYPPPPPKQTAAEEKPPPPPRDWAWLEPAPVYDVPIVFVPDTNAEWSRLAAFWNPQPQPLSAAVLRPIGLPPLQAAVTFVLARQAEKIIIKVPRGLPDPTPFIPAANPPTLAKWHLGRKLFFDKVLDISKYESLACASCHDPKTGFTEDRAINKLGERNTKNTPSLINSVFNRQQFWDGRVRFLEQTIVTGLNDENLPRDERPAKHVWSGLVKTLRESPEYRRRFQQVFGIREPTQDAIAKALATYMRTVLSGDSLYDRAEHERKKEGAADLAVQHFEAVLDDAALKALEQTKKQETATALLEGVRLFHGKARCALCHPGPLFTDHDFHNIGLDETDIEQLGGLNQGRFDHVPIGLKETRLVGAYRTPALRALPPTAPYMHNGKFKNLTEVVDYFDKGIDARWHRFLDPKLLEGPELAHPLELTAEQIRALVLFLKSLDGTRVDDILVAADLQSAVKKDTNR